ncbi:MAG: hypothetical protein Q9214_000413 [Letrouitia sp. 1 TL-2023]
MNDRGKSKNVKESKISEQLKRKSKTRRWRKNEVVIPRAKQETTVRTNKESVLTVNKEFPIDRTSISFDSLKIISSQMSFK